MSIAYRLYQPHVNQGDDEVVTPDLLAISFMSKRTERVPPTKSLPWPSE